MSARDLALRPDDLAVLSLCTGGAGLELGLELAVPRARVVCSVEWEAFAAARLVAAMQAGVLAPAPLWSDLRTFDGRPWRGVVDIVVAGYPCQPFSAAGRRAGSRDPRHLWPEVFRVVQEVRPPVVFLENVANHLRLGFDLVRRDLERAGYRVTATLVRASDVGASHERERLFILGVENAARARGPGRERQGRRGGRRGVRPPGEQLVDAARPRRRGGRTDGGADRGAPGADGRRGAQPPRGGAALADAGRGYPERRPDAGGAGGAPGARDRQGLQRERGGRAAGVSGGDLAEPARGGHRGDRQPSGATGQSLCRGESLVDAARDLGRSGVGRAETGARASGLGRGGSPGAGGQLADADGDGRAGERGELSRDRDAQSGPDPSDGGADVGDARRCGRDGDARRGPGSEPADGRLDALPLFPPGPGEIAIWRRILAAEPGLAPAVEPALRRLADGLAGPERRHWLRLLGNGVVPLQAAYAFCALWASREVA